jgi:hypothetical protein
MGSIEFRVVEDEINPSSIILVRAKAVKIFPQDPHEYNVSGENTKELELAILEDAKVGHILDSLFP